jgi:hypothetical protein
MKPTKKFIQVPHILALNTVLNLSFQMVYDMWADGNFFFKVNRLLPTMTQWRIVWRIWHIDDTWIFSLESGDFSGHALLISEKSVLRFFTSLPLIP